MGFSGPGIFINRSIQKPIVGVSWFIQKWSIFVKKRMLVYIYSPTYINYREI